MIAPESKVFFEDNIAGMKRFPDKAFNLCLVDTNWGIGEDGRKVRTCNAIQPNGTRRKARQTADLSQRWDDEPPPPEFWVELFRVGVYFIIFGENYLSFPQKDSSSGRIFWNKCVTGDFSDGEMCWTNLFKSVRMITYMWSGMNQGKSLKEPHIMQGNKSLNEVRLQPGQKPVLLYQQLLADHAKPGYKILSTNTGSGSDRIASWHAGLDYTGFENNEKNFRRQEKRFREECLMKPDLHRGY